MDPKELREGENEFGHRNIPNARLTPAMIPPPDAAWPAISRFALTFDAYQVWGGRTADIANGILADFERRKPLPKDATLLRTALFFEQRRYHHFGRAPDGAALAYIRALLARLHDVVIRRKSAHA